MLQKDQNNLRPAKRRKAGDSSKASPKSSKKPIASNSPTNMILSILNARGYKSVVPMDDVLQTLDMTIHRFNKILDNKTELTLTEATGFANWLGITVEELTPNHPPTVADKYGLNN
jgi:hypothetical protein